MNKEREREREREITWIRYIDGREKEIEIKT